MKRQLRKARAHYRAWRSRSITLGQFTPRPALVLPQTEVTEARYPLIDVHTHLGRWLTNGRWCEPDVPALVSRLDQLNVATVVNLDGRFGAELEANLDRYDQAYPGRFATFCHLDWKALQGSDPAAALTADLARSKLAGARGIKVWKDLGLSVRDSAGQTVLMDDPRLFDVWRQAGELKLPVLVHAADPISFFQPADRYNERLEELRMHPQPAQQALGITGRERLLDALLTVVDQHPGTTFIGAHLASLSEDLGRLDRVLTRWPNLYVDIGARLADIGRQPRAFARLSEQHPSRILFGSDVYPIRTEETRLYLRCLQTTDEYFPYWSGDRPGLQGRWFISGVGLADHLLERLYYGNAAALGLGPVPLSSMNPIS